MTQETLTRREQQMAEAVARGLTNREIAVEFGLSPETVKKHLQAIYGKLAIGGRLMLALHVVRTREEGRANGGLIGASS
jgi:DNA-binding NarL/FixJ family response regulator